MTATFHRYISAGILLIWGGVLTGFYFSGKIGSYLHPSFHLWTVLSGLTLLLMAVGMVMLPGTVNNAPQESVPQTPGPRSRLGKIFAALILIAPLLMATIVSPHQFGAALVANRGLATGIGDLPGYTPYVEPALPGEEGEPSTAQEASDFLPRTEEGLIKAQSVDLLYAAEEPTMRADFEDQDVELIGQYMPARANNAAGDRFDLVRMYVMCCAADARPVGVTIQTAQPQNLAEMSWVQVKGRATFPLVAGRRVPVIIASSVTPTEAPPESFVY